jgi:TM2 domain.
MKQYILTFAFLLSAVAVFGQNKQEVVRLKNGSVVKGTVVGERNDSIAVKTADGSTFIFATSDITERTAEATSLAQRVAASAQADAQPQVVYIEHEKSPALAGFLSFLVPGVGQFYNGNNQGGWIDLGESVVSYALMYGGYRSLLTNATRYNETGNNQYLVKGQTGLWIFLAGLGWSAVNGVCSIVDAVKGAKAVNRENGYAMFDVGGGVSVGARPQLTYEQPEYAMHIPASLNAGMSFRIAF